MSFKDKVVIVTGSSSGIGASTAIEFAKEGARVVVVGRNEKNLKSVSEKCEKFGNKTLAIKADVSKDIDGKRIISETVAKYGTIDVLVNNAGAGESIDITSDDFMESYDRIINVNLRAVVYITHCSIPYLIKSKGNIINVSSIAATTTMNASDYIPYCVSKAGVNHFTRSTALNLSGHGIRVNTVSPGPVRTNIIQHIDNNELIWEKFRKSTALGRLSEPQEISDLILYLASDKAKGITGSEFLTDNGYLIKG